MSRDKIIMHNNNNNTCREQKDGQIIQYLDTVWLLSKRQTSFNRNTNFETINFSIHVY